MGARWPRRGCPTLPSPSRPSARRPGPRRARPGTSEPGPRGDMGFFHGDHGSGPWVQDSVAVTPREFAGLVTATLGAVRGSGDTDTCQLGVIGRTRMPTLESLSARLHESPDDATAHRMMALAHLRAGNAQGAAHHLGIAAAILLGRCSDARTLRASLSAHLELKLLGIILVPYCRRLGKPEGVERLLREVLLVW